MANVLPEGFILDGPVASAELPAGFTIDAVPAKVDEPFLSPTMETVASMITEPAAKIASGLAGIASAPFIGMQEAGDVIEKVQSFAYTPKSEESKEQLKAIGELPFIKQLGQVAAAYEAKSIEAGDVISSEAHPITGAIYRGMSGIMPDVIGLLTGQLAIAPVITAFRMSKNGIENTVKTITGNPDAKVFDSSGQVTPESIEIVKQAQTQGVDVDSIAQKEILKSVDDGKLLTPDDLESLSAQARDQSIQTQQPILSAVDMIDNYNTFIKRGVSPTRANVTQNIDDWRFQQDAIKKDGDVNKIVVSQDRVLNSLAQEGKASMGFEAVDSASTGGHIFDSINDIAETYDTAVTDAYKAAREVASEEKNISLDGLMDVLKKNAGNETVSGGLISSLRGELKNRGVIDRGWESKGRVNVETSEAIRSSINALHDSISPHGRSIAFELKEALDNDVAKVVGEDIFKKARLAKIDFHKLFSRDKANKWEKNRSSFINDILTGAVNQDDIVKKLGTIKPELFDDAKDFFLNRSGDAGVSVWNNIKAQFIDDAMTTSGGASGAIDGKKIDFFNAAQFTKKINQLKGRSGGKGKRENRYEAMFNADERALFDDIITIGNLRRPDPRVPQGSGPSAMAIDAGTNSLLEHLARPRGVRERVGSGAKSIAKGIQNRRQKRQELEFINPQIQLKETVDSAR